MGCRIEDARDELDRRRRAAKLLKRARAADIAIVSAGKSGRTWLRTLVSHIYHQRHGLPVNALINFDNFHRVEPSIPRILFAGLAADALAPSGRPWGMEIVRAPRLVLLTRDPRDVAVSTYFQWTERAPQRALRRKGIASADDIRALSMVAFLTSERFGVPRLNRFVAAWAEVTAAHPCALRVTYEALRNDPSTTFASLARFIDACVSDDEIAAAVAFASFSTMKARERSGFYATERLQAGATHNPDSFKVRRGKIGGYRDYLSDAEIAVVDALVADIRP